MSQHRIYTLLASTAAFALGTVMAPTPTHATDPHWATYIALGDSYAAGPGLPDFEFEPCERSQHNYAHNLAAELDVDGFIDATCGAAVTDDFSRSQKPGAIPQFDAITHDADLVTVTIGGNDAGFAEVLMTCGIVSITPGITDPCREFYNRSGVDELELRLTKIVAPQLHAVFVGIRQRAPHAVVLATGYPRLTPTVGACYPDLPFAPGDYSWINGLQDKLNATIEEQAEAAGIEYVDLLAPSAGHDACAAPDGRWVEPVQTTRLTPAHPNYTGMEAIARIVADRLAAHSEQPG